MGPDGEKKGRAAGACALCGSDSAHEMFSSDGGGVMKCRGCGLVFLVPPESTGEMYSPDYFHEREDYFFRDGVVDETGLERSHVRDFSEGLDWIGRYAPSAGGRLLDVGCALGSFLSLAKKRGWQCNGVEISEYASSIARKRLGEDVRTGSLIDASFPEGHFDAVTMWDLIEHLPDPLSALREARRVLKEGGVLLVNTPNEDSFMRALARAIYRASGGTASAPVRRLYHRYHLFYFNDRTMRGFFEKAGLEVLDMRKKVIPIDKGRGSALAKAVVRALSIVEAALGREYELFYILRKPRGEEAGG